jgi:DNA-binding NarL/FixJ family response regulator
VISILIVGDIRLYRDGLARLLDRHEQIDVVGTAESQQVAIQLIQALHPRVVLLDIAMPGGLGAVKNIAAAAPDAKIVALAVPESSREVVACAEAGVAGYVPRDGSLNDLVSTLQSVDEGELRCSPRIAAGLLRRVAQLAAESGTGIEGVRLTPRELEIVGLVDQGMTNKDIARHLGIEVATAKNHVHNILEKLHVHHRGEAAARLRDHLPRYAPRWRAPVSDE